MSRPIELDQTAWTLNEIARMAYGSSEKTEGGRGNMGLIKDAQGRTRVIKYNTHFGTSGKGWDIAAQLEATTQLRKTLLEIAGQKSPCKETLDEIREMLGVGPDGAMPKDLLDRKVVAKVVQRIDKDIWEHALAGVDIKGYSSKKRKTDFATVRAENQTANLAVTATKSAVGVRQAGDAIAKEVFAALQGQALFKEIRKDKSTDWEGFVRLTVEHMMAEGLEKHPQMDDAERGRLSFMVRNLVLATFGLVREPVRAGASPQLDAVEANRLETIFSTFAHYGAWVRSAKAGEGPARCGDTQAARCAFLRNILETASWRYDLLELAKYDRVCPDAYPLSEREARYLDFRDGLANEDISHLDGEEAQEDRNELYGEVAGLVDRFRETTDEDMREAIGETIDRKIDDFNRANGNVLARLAGGADGENPLPPEEEAGDLPSRAKATERLVAKPDVRESAALVRKAERAVVDEIVALLQDQPQFAGLGDDEIEQLNGVIGTAVGRMMENELGRRPHLTTEECRRLAIVVRNLVCAAFGLERQRMDEGGFGDWKMDATAARRLEDLFVRLERHSAWVRTTELSPDPLMKRCRFLKGELTRLSREYDLLKLPEYAKVFVGFRPTHEFEEVFVEFRDALLDDSAFCMNDEKGAKRRGNLYDEMSLIALRRNRATDLDFIMREYRDYQLDNADAFLDHLKDHPDFDKNDPKSEEDRKRIYDRVYRLHQKIQAPGETWGGIVNGIRDLNRIIKAVNRGLTDPFAFGEDEHVSAFGMQQKDRFVAEMTPPDGTLAGDAEKDFASVYDELRRGMGLKAGGQVINEEGHPFAGTSAELKLALRAAFTTDGVVDEKGLRLALWTVLQGADMQRNETRFVSPNGLYFGEEKNEAGEELNGVRTWGFEIGKGENGDYAFHFKLRKEAMGTATRRKITAMPLDNCCALASEQIPLSTTDNYQQLDVRFSCRFDGNAVSVTVNDGKLSSKLPTELYTSMFDDQSFITWDDYFDWTLERNWTLGGSDLRQVSQTCFEQIDDENEFYRRWSRVKGYVFVPNAERNAKLNAFMESLARAEGKRFNPEDFRAWRKKNQGVVLERLQDFGNGGERARLAYEQMFPQTQAFREELRFLRVLSPESCMKIVGLMYLAELPVADPDEVEAEGVKEFEVVLDEEFGED